MVKALVFDWGDTLMRDFNEYNGPMAFWPRVELMSNVDKALEAIRGEYICCVASNAGASDGKLLGDALDRVGIKKYFSYMLTSKELGFNKPDPRFYGEIPRHTGFKALEHVMIGNDYNRDIKPAKEAGMRTILVSKILPEGSLEAADYVINDMIELIDILNNL